MKTEQERAEALWAKLCTDCAHEPRKERCDCLDDILAAFAEYRADQQEIMRINNSLRGTLLVIKGLIDDVVK